jgi:hypothetical protein
MRARTLLIGLALAMPVSAAYAQAVNSYQSNEAWGTGTASGGVSGAIMHNQFGQSAALAQRARCGQPLVAGTNQAIGTMISVSNYGTGNSVNGSSLNGSNTGQVTNNGAINGLTANTLGKGCK